MQYTLGRETQSVAAWAKAIGPLHQDARDFPVKGFGEFVGTWAKAVSYVGESELYARRAERYEVFGLDDTDPGPSWKRFERLNSTGVEGLTQAKAQLGKLQSGLGSYDQALKKAGRNIGAELEAHRAALFSDLAEIELKRTDAEQLRGMVDEAIGVASKEGLKGLGTWAEKQLGSAIDARHAPDRGASTNFAWWKLAAVIALLIVLGIAFAIHCGIFGCGVSSRNSYVSAILTVAGLWWC